MVKWLSQNAALSFNVEARLLRVERLWSQIAVDLHGQLHRQRPASGRASDAVARVNSDCD
jgi:hypothetical protein